MRLMNGWRFLLLWLCAVTVESLAQEVPDGELDPSFVVERVFKLGGVGISTAVGPGGEIAISGDFVAVNGNARSNLALLDSDGGLDLNFAPEINDRVSAVAFQVIESELKVLIGGSFTQVNGVTRNHIARLNSDGTLDTDFNPGANSAPTSFLVLDDNKIMVTGNFTEIAGVSPLNRVARLNTDGSRDTSFTPDLFNGSVEGIIESGNQFFVFGRFTAQNGVPSRVRLINNDGTSDLSFAPDQIDSNVFAVEIQSDGDIVVAGTYNNVGTVARRGLARFEPDGTLDMAYNPAPNSNQLRAMIMQSDDKVIVSGLFVGFGNPSSLSISPSLARIDTDGSLDTSFMGPNQASIINMSQQANGDVLYTGTFTEVLFRTSDEGVVDTSFADNAFESGIGEINDFAFPNSDQVLVAGSFSSIDGIRVDNIALLDQLTGDVITSFPAKADQEVLAVEIQRDGKILIGGQFDEVNGNSQPHVARLLADGELDVGFTPNTSNAVFDLFEDRQGRVMIGGNFQTVGGVTQRSLARLLSDGSRDATFASPLIVGNVESILPLGDGYLVGGTLSEVNSIERNSLALINGDGTHNTAFPNLMLDGRVNDIEVLSDDSILIAGEFQNAGVTALSRLAKIDALGTIDESFTFDFSGPIFDLEVQFDDAILAAGRFFQVDGNDQPFLARITPEGTFDDQFSPDFDNSISAIGLNQENQIFAGGIFEVVDTSPRRIARLSNVVPDDDLCVSVVTKQENVVSFCL